MTRKELLQVLYTKRNNAQFEYEYLESLNNRTYEQENLMQGYKALVKSYTLQIEKMKEVVNSATAQERSVRQ